MARIKTHGFYAYDNCHETIKELIQEYFDVDPDSFEDGYCCKLAGETRPDVWLIFDKVSVERMPSEITVVEVYEWQQEADSVVADPTTESPEDPVAESSYDALVSMGLREPRP